jgi:hypothetical protein
MVEGLPSSWTDDFQAHRVRESSRIRDSFEFAGRNMPLAEKEWMGMRITRHQMTMFLMQASRRRLEICDTPYNSSDDSMTILGRIAGRMWLGHLRRIEFEMLGPTPRSTSNFWVSPLGWLVLLARPADYPPFLEQRHGESRQPGTSPLPRNLGGCL